MAEPSLVARRIQEIRTAKKISRQQLADELETRRPRGKRSRWTYLQIYRIETGVTDVSADTAAEVAQALQVSVASLYREARAS